MIVDGDYDENLIVWSETLSITPDSDYEFTMYYGKVDYPNNDYAKLQVTMNGEQVGSITTASSTTWAPLSETWNSGTNTSV